MLNHNALSKKTLVPQLGVILRLLFWRSLYVFLFVCGVVRRHVKNASKQFRTVLVFVNRKTRRVVVVRKVMSAMPVKGCEVVPISFSLGDDHLSVGTQWDVDRTRKQDSDVIFMF